MNRSAFSSATILALLFFVFGLVPAAHAQLNTKKTAAGGEKVFTSMTAAELKGIMLNEGYEVRIDDKGIARWTIDGTNCQIFIDDDGDALQFHVAYGDGSATLKKVNEWNKTKRYSRTYLDDEGDPHLELDLDLAGGVTKARVEDFLVTCKISLSAWHTAVVKE